MYSSKTELFEVELINSIKMDLALNSLQRLICHKPKQPINQLIQIIFLEIIFKYYNLTNWWAPKSYNLQCGPESNENKVVPRYFPEIWDKCLDTESSLVMQLLFRVCRGCSRCILNPVDRIKESEKEMIGLVSLFNGISTFVGYLMPKPFSEKNGSGTI